MKSTERNGAIPLHAALIACTCLVAASAGRAPADPPTQPAAAGSVKLVRVVPPAPPSEHLGRIVSVFARHVAERCPAKVVLQGEAPLTVALAFDPAIGAEGFRISDRAGAGIEVAGRDEPGVLYGLGKLLRTSRYSPDGFAPGAWRGESVPAKPVRGIYFATHFHNFYHDGPVEDIQRYVEELALWGCNSLMVWFDMHHFEGFDDPEAVAFRKRLGAILQPVADLGMSSAFVMVGNEGYADSPEELRSRGGKRGGYYECQVCTGKKAGMEYELRIKAELLDWMRPFRPRHICLWPFDQGGCDCEQCRPWALNGFLQCAKPAAGLAREKLPGARIILSNWYYNGNELRELGKILSAGKPWVDYVMGPVPGADIPAVNFPEISMLGVEPWGGFGATPVPRHLQDTYSKMDNLKGGWPYSEGLHEDMNKVAMLQLYWNPEQPVVETLREYAGYEFAPEVAEDVVRMVRTLEKNFRGRNRIGADAIQAYALAQKVDARLPPEARTSWRWRILCLRALIDREMHLTKGRLEGNILRDAFAELTRIYHAEDALEGWLKPPQVKQGNR